MKHLNFFTFILSLFFTFSQIYSESLSNEPFVTYIQQNGFASVKHREGAKLYLNENALIPTARGMLFFGGGCPIFS